MTLRFHSEEIQSGLSFQRRSEWQKCRQKCHFLPSLLSQKYINSSAAIFFTNLPSSSVILPLQKVCVSVCVCFPYSGRLCGLGRPQAAGADSP